MTNREIAKLFNLLGKLKELHGENPFRTRAYTSAYVAIRKLADPVYQMDGRQLIQINGIGKTIADKIEELQKSGQINALNTYLDKTPAGVVEMLGIKGFGPKKVRTVWKEMGIESPGELLYACHENRLVELKGFGEKTQESLKKQVSYFLDSQGKYLYGHIEEEGMRLLELVRAGLGKTSCFFSGDFRRKMPVLEGISLSFTVDREEATACLRSIKGVELVDGQWSFEEINLIFFCVEEASLGKHLFETSASEEFLSAFYDRYGETPYTQEKDYFEKNGLAFIPPVSRESDLIINLASDGQIERLIAETDIRGVVHAHSTYSDGTNTLREMVDASRARGYQYLVISDHSKAAFYANGLTEDRVMQQAEEIDFINSEYSDFYVFKSIECDILNEGQLDYEDDFLHHFDLVIASVHSNLKMDQEKAHHRLLRAIENPHTRILGHPTGRLLLSREGYPIDHKAIIDACARHGVAIEINASPYRLDLDWTWVAYAAERGVLLSINPDAHSVAGIDDIRYGVAAAQKAGLLKTQCLNTKETPDFMAWVNNP